MRVRRSHAKNSLLYPHNTVSAVSSEDYALWLYEEYVSHKTRMKIKLEGGKVAKMNTASQKYRLELFEILTSRFNLQEFQTLCFAIPVNYDLLEGGDLGSKARELVLFMMRYGRLQELVETGRTIRPDITWPNIPSSKTQKQDWKKFDKELARARSTPIQVKVRPGTGRSKLFMFSRAIATMIVFAVLFQVFGGPIIEAVTCGPGMPMPCLALGNSWWIIGAMLGFLTGLGLLPESSGSK